MSVTDVSIKKLISAVAVTSTKTYLQIHYPEVDEKNHKSLESLVHHLETAGFQDVAILVRAQAEVLVFDSMDYAIKVFDYLEEHTAAISATLYHRNMVGTNIQN